MRAVELCGERVRTGHGDGFERVAGGDSDEGEIRPGDDTCGLRDVVERSVQRRAARSRRDPAHQGIQCQIRLNDHGSGSIAIGHRPYTSRVAASLPDEDEAPVDPSAIELRYRYHRARRQARVRAKEETQLARYRFYIVMAVLLAIAIGFVIVSWHEIQRLFGI